MLQPHNGDSSQEQAKAGNGGHPHVDKARGKVISVRAQGTPSLLVATEGLLELRSGREIAAPELAQRAVAREGACLEDGLSHVAEDSHGLHSGCTCATVQAIVGACLFFSNTRATGGEIERGEERAL